MSMTDAAQPNATPVQPDQTPPTVQPGTTQDAGVSLTQAQIDAIVQSRLAEERRRTQAKYGDLDELLAIKQADDQRRAAEMSEVEKALAKAADLEKQLAAKDAEIAAANLTALRLRVGQEIGLPPVLAARLQGADEAALKADAEAVKAVLGQAAQPPTIPNLNATAGGAQQGGRSAGTKLTPEQRAIADQYGISYDKYAESLHQFGE